MTNELNKIGSLMEKSTAEELRDGMNRRVRFHFVADAVATNLQEYVGLFADHLNHGADPADAGYVLARMGAYSMIVLALTNGSPKVRTAAVGTLRMGLRSLPVVGATPQVVALLNDKVPAVRVEAAETLRLLATDRTFGEREMETLFSVLSADPEPKVRILVAGALGKLRRIEPHEKEKLEDLARRESNPYVHRAMTNAVEALRARGIGS